jgi:hypothetical protein
MMYGAIAVGCVYIFKTHNSRLFRIHSLTTNLPLVSKIAVPVDVLTSALVPFQNQNILFHFDYYPE